jgi:hypothetical protein
MAPLQVTGLSRASSQASGGFTTIVQRNSSPARSSPLLTHVRWISQYPDQPDECLQTGKRSFTNRALHATLTNPHKDSSESLSAFEYEGYAYPVREYIYFVLEQKNADYEILSVVLHEARAPTVNVLKGMISGIGVEKEVSYIAARPWWQ